MKKATSNKKEPSTDNDMLPEYDFSGGVRGKHFKAYRRGHTVKIHQADGSVSIHYFKPEEGAVMLEPDVQEYFSDAETVNKALRTLIELIPKNRNKQKRAYFKNASHANIE